jgi:hypothetical protein
MNTSQGLFSMFSRIDVYNFDSSYLLHFLIDFINNLIGSTNYMIQRI